MFIARAADHATRFSQAPYAGVIDLPRGYVATPLTQAVMDALGPEPSCSARIEAAAKGLSADGPVVYLETSDFGGTGGKTAAAWKGGKRVLAVWEGEASAYLDGVGEGNHAFDRVMFAGFGRGNLDMSFLSMGRPEDAYGQLGLGQWRDMDAMLEAVAR